MFGTTLKSIRIAQNRSLKDIAQAIHIDPSLLSRIEREERKATEVQVHDLAVALQANPEDLIKHWLSDKVFDVLDDYPMLAKEVLLAMETRIEYLNGPKALQKQDIPKDLADQIKRIDELQ